jgi:hypothetical protein
MAAMIPFQAGPSVLDSLADRVEFLQRLGKSTVAIRFAVAMRV